MLTRKQFDLLRFIHERLKEAGVPPSFDEMKDALDLRSKSHPSNFTSQGPTGALLGSRTCQDRSVWIWWE